MNKSWAAFIVCAFAVLALTFVSGCAAYKTPDNQRRRAYTMKTDMENMVDDVDWVLGQHRPSLLYDEGMR